MATPQYTALANLTLSATSSAVDFTSISQSYRDLMLVVTQPSGDMRLYTNFNGDSGTNYSQVHMQGDGSAAASYNGTGDTAVWSPYQNSGGTTSGVQILHIMDYAQTNKHKTVLSRSNQISYQVAAGAHRWASTSAITSITCSTGGSWAAGSTFALYGVK